MGQKSTTTAVRKTPTPIPVTEVAKEPAHRPAVSLLVDPFCYEAEERIDLEKAIRAVGFLLTWGSDGGNEPLSGQAVHGLAQLLDHSADTVARGMLSKQEALDIGADVYKLYNVGERPQVGKVG